MGSGRERDTVEKREREREGKERLLASEPVISFGDHGRQRKGARGGASGRRHVLLMCLCRRQASASSLLSLLVSLIRLRHSTLSSISATRLVLLTLPPARAHLFSENTHASLPVSDTFRQESRPSSLSLRHSISLASTHTLNKILPGSHEDEGGGGRVKTLRGIPCTTAPASEDNPVGTSSSSVVRSHRHIVPLPLSPVTNNEHVNYVYYNKISKFMQMDIYTYINIVCICRRVHTCIHTCACSQSFS